jgi:hypothetical protein
VILGARRAGAALAAGALLVVAVLGTGHRSSDTDTAPAWSGRLAADIGFLLVGMALAAGVVILWHAAPRVRLRRSKEPRRAPRRLAAGRGGVALVIAVVALVPVTFAVIRAVAQTGEHRSPRTPAIHPRPPAPPVGRTPGTGHDVDVTLALVGAAAVVLVVAFAARRGRQAAGSPVRSTRRRDAGMPEETDWPTEPRARVLVAYRRGESLLAAGGLVRDPAEAPREFRDRARVRGVGDPDALADLTGLYERARFSPHHITVEMGREAREAWASIRDRLGAGE